MAHSLNPDLWLDNYGDYLYSYSLSRLSNASLAEDLIQETFLAALKAAPSFKGNSSFKTWLTSILKRKIIDHFRKNSRKKEYSVEDFSSPFIKEGIKKGSWDQDRVPSPWDEDKKADIHNDAFMHTVDGCLSDLQEKWRSVFVLKTMEGLSTEEICKVMDITPSNLWVIMHRSRLQLRECMEKKWFKE